MEESEKRRERLKAMRTEAAQGDVSNDAGDSSVSHDLSNPLIENSAHHQDLSAPQRFDYYTDPMSAYSGNKRRSKVSHQNTQEYFTPPRPHNTLMTPPALQSKSVYAADQGMHQPLGNFRSPIAVASPFSVQSGTPPAFWNGSGGTSGYYLTSDAPRGGRIPSPDFGQGRNPNLNCGQGRGHWFSNCPGPGSVRGGNPSFGQEHGPGFRSDQGRGHWFSNSPSPGPGRGGSPGPGRGSSPGPGRGDSPGFGQVGRPSFHSGQGRGNWFRNSPGPGSGRGDSPGPSPGRGRGRGFGNSVSPGSGWSGGRGKGSHNNVSAELRPDLYYNKSMVEDPWKFLEPVIWKKEEISKSWLPKSISMKKAKVTEASSMSKSQPSLAEYLAASFNEAVKNEETNDEPDA